MHSRTLWTVVEGDDGESFYVLLLGKVSVDKRSGGKWVPLSELGPGETFGEMTLIDDKVRSARVRTLARSEPDPGSLIPMQKNASPRQILGK